MQPPTCPFAYVALELGFWFMEYTLSGCFFWYWRYASCSHVVRQSSKAWGWSGCGTPWCSWSTSSPSFNLSTTSSRFSLISCQRLPGRPDAHLSSLMRLAVSCLWLMSSGKTKCIIESNNPEPGTLWYIDIWSNKYQWLFRKLKHYLNVDNMFTCLHIHMFTLNKCIWWRHIQFYIYIYICIHISPHVHKHCDDLKGTWVNDKVLPKEHCPVRATRPMEQCGKLFPNWATSHCLCAVPPPWTIKIKDGWHVDGHG